MATLNNTPTLGPLDEADLQRSPAPRVPRIPMHYMPAEACTELGADDNAPRTPLSNTEAACLVVIAITSLSIVAALALHLWRAVS